VEVECAHAKNKFEGSVNQTRSHCCLHSRLVDTLRPFPGMQHLDVAGGTGDVAFRVLRAIRAAESQQAAQRAGQTNKSKGSQPRQPTPPQPASIQTGSQSSSAGPAPSGVEGTSQGQAGQPQSSPILGSVVVCDINPQMLEEGQKKAQAAADLSKELAGNRSY
jgi:2-methoxy-6-polyprenyl-1,4-benzoquinol methylase